MKDDLSDKWYLWVPHEITNAETECTLREYPLRDGIEVNIKCYTSVQHVERKVIEPLKQYLDVK